MTDKKGDKVIEGRWYVHATAFFDMQRERDALQRHLTLLQADFKALEGREIALRAVLQEVLDELQLADARHDLQAKIVLMLLSRTVQPAVTGDRNE